MKAGASSMWASCCGLLNEVIGTGAVRSQPPTFGGGAGPFRFAPSAGYSTYPPASPASTSSGLVCKACGLAFSVFRRKHVCSDCKKAYCSLCSVLQENLRRCTTCHLLWGTAFQRPQLMRLRVKDLRLYLTLRNISTDTCREKEDLVDLVLCHLGAQLEDDDDEEEEEEQEQQQQEREQVQEEEEEQEEEQEEEGDSLRSPLPPIFTPPSNTTHTRSASQHSTLSVSASQGEAPSPSNSSGTSQDNGDIVSVALLEPSEILLESSPVTQRRARASLSDLAHEDDIEALSVRQLKEILARNFVNFSGCCEKWELLERVHRLYREDQVNRRSMENVSITAVVAYPPPICDRGVAGESVVAPLAVVDDSLCRICMDAVIDCVLLECGHMVTCTKCGKRMSECPICRQYVVRAVHVFKS